VGLGLKMALLFGLFLLPIGLLVGLLVHEKGLAIEFAVKEVEGVSYLRALQALRRGFEQGQDLASPLKAVDEQERLWGQDMSTAAELKALKEALDKPGRAPAQDAWDAVYAKVGDQSNLILDPDLDTYYLMDMILSRLPLLQDRLIGMQGAVGSGAAAGLRGELNDQAAAVERNLSVAYAQPNNAQLEARIAPTFEVWKQAEISLLGALDRCQSGHCAGLGKPSTVLDLAGDTLLDQGMGELERLLQRRIQGFRHSRDSTLTVVALLLALCAALAWRLASSVVRPVRRLNQRLDAIIQEGDLRPMDADPGRDEVGQLSRSLAAVVEQLRGIPQALSESADLLAQAVEALQAATASQNAVVTRQATALQETQVTAEEIRQTSLMAARSAQNILSRIASAESAGEQGAQALESTLGGLQGILNAAQATAASIVQLGERAREIGGITATVKDLADQSNMLALNAAIEAVRSGEHGKGFALVAREIRRLADQSIQSTERVRDILEGVRKAVEASQEGSEEEARTVESCLGQMRGNSENLRALTAVVSDTSTAVRQIVTAVEQQDAGVNQVFAAVVDQNKMMEDSVSQLEGTLEAVSKLKTVSVGLAELLARYRV
jgi:methyl-accepting chemotaxis protein